MKKAIVVGLALILMLSFVISCGIPQEEYDKVSSDLAAAQTQIQLLQDDLTAAQTQIQSLQGDLAEAQAQIQPLQDDKEAAEEKRAQALAYAEYLDILLYEIWEGAGLTPRFAFEDDIEWLIELEKRADSMGDAELSDYFKELEERSEGAMERLWFYCLDRIEKILE